MGLKSREDDLVQDGELLIAAVFTDPDAAVLLVHADGLRVPVGEIADVVLGDQLGGGAVEQIDGVGIVLRFVLVGYKFLIPNMRSAFCWPSSVK